MASSTEEQPSSCIYRRHRLTSAVLSSLFEAVHPSRRHRAKFVAHLAPSVCLETVRRWLRGEREPTAGQFLEMLGNSPVLRTELVRLLGEFDAQKASIGGASAAATRPALGVAGRMAVTLAKAADRVDGMEGGK